VNSAYPPQWVLQAPHALTALPLGYLACYSAMMEKSKIKDDLKAAVVSLLAAAAACDSREWVGVAANVRVTIEHCSSIIAQLDIDQSSEDEG
jgi:hypothetical protein